MLVAEAVPQFAFKPPDRHQVLRGGGITRQDLAGVDPLAAPAG